MFIFQVIQIMLTSATVIYTQSSFEKLIHVKIVNQLHGTQFSIVRGSQREIQINTLTVMNGAQDTTYI